MRLKKIFRWLWLYIVKVMLMGGVVCAVSYVLALGCFKFVEWSIEYPEKIDMIGGIIVFSVLAYCCGFLILYGKD